MNEAPITSYELVACFSAKRLERVDRPAHANALLQRVAEEMGRTFRATTPFRTLTRLAEQSASPNQLGDVDSVLHVGLLQRYGSEVTFLHEQIGLYFEAESFIRTHSGDALAQIAMPERRRLAPFVIAGLENPGDIRTCSVALRDEVVLRGMLTGEYGPRPQAVAIGDASALLARAALAIQAASVSVQRDSRPYALLPMTVKLGNVPPLEPYEGVTFEAVGASVRSAILLDEVLAVLEATERVFYAAIERRHRPSVFADLFVLGGGDRPPLPASILMHAARSGYFSEGADAHHLLPRLEPLSGRSDAAVYLACVILRRSDLRAADALRFFREAWGRDIYHLRLVALELLESRRSSASDSDITDIRAALERCQSNNIMLNGAIIDTMLAYDMVESPVSEDSAAACARLNHPFAVFPSLSKNHEAWSLLAEIVYLMNGGRTGRSATELWRVLIASFARETIEPLKELKEWLWQPETLSEVTLDLVGIYPDEYRRLMEEVVRGGVAVTSIRPMRNPRLVEEGGRFVLGTLARLGGPESVEILRPLVADPKWGVAVVDAIRAIQSRCR